MLGGTEENVMNVQSHENWLVELVLVENKGLQKLCRSGFLKMKKKFRIPSNPWQNNLSINLFFSFLFSLELKGVVALSSTKISSSLYSICSYYSGRVKCLEVVWLSLQCGHTPAEVFQTAVGSWESQCSHLQHPSSFQILKSGKGDPSCYVCVGEGRNLPNRSCSHVPVLFQAWRVL